MIDTVTFETATGRIIMPFEDYGLILANHSVSPPKPKLYMVNLEGANGSIDFTEWAGEVKYEDRTVELMLRDMHDDHSQLIQALNGRRCKIVFSDDRDHYFDGRCTAAETETRRRVTDVHMTFTCKPWRFAKALSVVSQDDVSGGAAFRLIAARMPAKATVVLSAQCTLVWDGHSETLDAGTHTPSWFVVTDTAKMLTVSGTGSISISWRDGVL